MRVVLVCFLLGAPAEALAQQTLFNVPSTQETITGKLFGQVQASATAFGGEVNTTLELGITPWLELGVNVLHVPLYRMIELEPSEPSTPSFLLNANVYFDPLSFMAIEIGAQGGVGWRPPTAFGLAEPVVFGWATMRFDAPGRWGSYVVGVYTGTRGALGGGFPLGGMIGIEVPIVEHFLHAQADWMIGNNAISVAVVGAVVYVGRSFQSSAGAQLPSPGTTNAFGGVLELTYVPVPDDAGLGASSQRAQLPND